MIIKLNLLFSVLFLLLPTVCFSAEQSDLVPDPLPKIQAALDSYNKIKDYTALFLKQERFGKKILPMETIKFKFRTPNDIYMKWQKKPNKGQEVIFREGKNNGNIVVHKGGLLGLVTVNVNPKGALAMKNQHHPIFDAGIGATTMLVMRGLKNGLHRKEVMVYYHGPKNIADRKVNHFEALYPEKCDGEIHIVKQDQTLWDISKMFNQDMHVILSVNKGISSPTKLKLGQKILIPHHYCRKSDIFIDDKLGILVKLEIYDWNNNLYEMYHYRDLIVNVGLTDTDFDENNSEYKF